MIVMKNLRAKVGSDKNFLEHVMRKYDLGQLRTLRLNAVRSLDLAVALQWRNYPADWKANILSSSSGNIDEHWTAIANSG